ncbi:hypothetical protein, partial [Candidatus Allofournierella excrementavium]|uniref:hypothetical protein n=1 Tax=Candidatus Allofournierella excrementavium TaxID=2838591 RepID=UPI003A8B1155
SCWAGAGRTRPGPFRSPCEFSARSKPRSLAAARLFLVLLHNVEGLAVAKALKIFAALVVISAICYN